MSRDLGVVSIGDARVALVGGGPLAQAEVFERRQLGDALLAAIGAARLQVEVCFVTRVGEDPFGDWLIESWEREGLHLDYARRVAGHNGLVVMGASEEGREALVFHEGAAAAALDETDVAPVPWELARFCYAPGSTQALGAGARAAVVRAFELAREHGAQTVYDPMLRAGLWPGDQAALAQAACDEVLPLTDLLVLSAPFVTGKLLGEPGAEAAAREARRRGVPRVVVREQGRGCIVCDAQGTTRLEPPPAAGERRAPGSALAAAFDGALLGALARALPLREAAEVALEAAALRAAGSPGLEGIPTLEQVDARRRAAGRAALG